MTSSAERGEPVAMLDDFLAYTLAGTRPAANDMQGTCAGGVRWSWLDDGVLLLEPAASLNNTRSVLASAGVHGDETAPIELLSHLVRDIARGEATLTCRLLAILGNVDAMRDACRYRDDDLNRLFSGRHLQLPHSHEAPRAAALERAAVQFFDAASNEPGARWHIDMHTAIRASAFERFALLPHTGRPFSRAMFEWLGEARISAVLLHTTKGNTYSHFTAQACAADACTLELGKVRPFGQNDLTRFEGADQALRHLLAGTNGNTQAELPRAFTVIDQITKQSDAFELLVAPDVANFTPFAKHTLLARDGDYRYVVQHDEERLVFPNATVKPGLRAGLMVVETTEETHGALV
ncbi:Succinylglutamate desuccinylase [Paraburkholderia graminis C4D1M]|jgi:succinylglutamate desuccinylase|uniref:Succinylglutamate desuccinylase n=1 Tax=Paraburkholderia graminis (strain ATCC 700544 / DSM 17151 / LMG 18924 / NCIMB 13744 / C4D1M) TaxID=396598 RepID=B1G5B3_PARG4|nr:succinylglutamate desuccinylase [Paraburkholderia graminis]EDT08616.1 succinylglutamate desuccinylase [Paraburkholderia graminis C4D1M]CAB3645166.1 Succinylglutamate desuccinylase [Paraburkholderia graminis C4D1M]